MIKLTDNQITQIIYASMISKIYCNIINDACEPGRDDFISGLEEIQEKNFWKFIKENHLIKIDDKERDKKIDELQMKLFSKYSFYKIINQEIIKYGILNQDKAIEIFNEMNIINNHNRTDFFNIANDSVARNQKILTKTLNYNDNILEMHYWYKSFEEINPKIADIFDDLEQKIEDDISKDDKIIKFEDLGLMDLKSKSNN